MKNNDNPNYVSILMPVYNQGSFIKCAIKSLLNQAHTEWELIIIDDGSTDQLYETVICNIDDKRIKYLRNGNNKGLGYSLNRGLDAASYPLISYLPADDIYFENHLSTLLAEQIDSDADMVYSGLIYTTESIGGENISMQSLGKIENYSLQLVQVLHKKTDDRWIERSEFVTDDLDRMFWSSFRANNPTISCTHQATCEWISHLYQRHNIMNDRRFGGIYMYRTYYGVKEPIRFQSSVGNLIDEISHYEPFQKLEKTNGDGLKILIVGELSYNPERITALEKRGHKLYGLWINNPYNFNSVGHFPFGDIEDIPFHCWKEKVKEIKPDVIYALTNFKSIELAHHVLIHNPGIPFVWHFKEGPMYCRTYGLWNKLIDLYEKSDGIIFINETIRQWFNLFLRVENENTLVFDSDLPPIEWFTDGRKPLLSDSTGEIHTVIAGRLLGIGIKAIETLAHQQIHMHVYGDVFHSQSRMMLDEALALAPEFIHLHPNCPAKNWVSEFSQYDAGWLHIHESSNYGNLMRANWIDLNSPARMSTYAAAGLPMIMHDNTGHIVHHQQYLEEHGMAIAIKSIQDLKIKLTDKDNLSKTRENTWNGRDIFCFEHYADILINFFRNIMESK